MKINLSEKTIENHILIYLKSRGIFAWKNQSVGVFDPVKKIYRKSKNPFHLNGTSDIIGIYKGKMLAIEVKSNRGVVSEEQKEFINNINKLGGIAFIARSLDDVVEKLSNLS